jgi:hypothetical protein
MNQPTGETLANSEESSAGLERWIKELISQCEDEITLLESGEDNLMTSPISRLDPTEREGLRTRLIDLTRQEIEALSGLDIQTTSPEEVHATMLGFTDRRIALTPQFLKVENADLSET